MAAVSIMHEGPAEAWRPAARSVLPLVEIAVRVSFAR